MSAIGPPFVGHGTTVRSGLGARYRSEARSEAAAGRDVHSAGRLPRRRRQLDG